jgi:hypothetical protein
MFYGGDNMNELYEMKFHDVITPNTGNHVEIIRVPGGWIYTTYCKNGTGGHDMSSCFVPYDNEFTEAVKDMSVPF